MNTQIKDIRSPKITLDMLSDYLNSGATLDDVTSMIEMLREYQEGIKVAIEDWYQLIPDGCWGTRNITSRN